ncbi:MAG: hypothetical protein J5845_07825 [Lachnospiraceae bacterium]|nr:hypothetical protein [Lachnospiraceae bacterium]
MTGYIIGGAAAAAAVAAGIAAWVRSRRRTGDTARTKRAREIQAGSHIFKADVKDVGELLEVINEKALNRKGIDMEPEADTDRIMFRTANGVWSAELSGQDAEDAGYAQGQSLRLYRLSIDRRRTEDANAADEAAEAVLTALEKAFLTLDYNAIVEHVYRGSRKAK